MSVAGFERAQRGRTRRLVRARSSTRATRPPAACVRRIREVTAKRELSFWAYQLGEVVGGPAFTIAPRDARVPRATSGFPVNPEIRVLDSLEEVFAHCAALAGAPPRPRLRDRRCRRQGRRPRPATRRSASRHGRRAGRSPTSSRPRNAPRCCATSRCRSGAPAGPRRSPCSSRCSSVGRRSGWPRCTTRTRFAPRTSDRATPSSSARPATSSPRSSARCCRCGPTAPTPWRVPDDLPVPAAEHAHATRG